VGAEEASDGIEFLRDGDIEHRFALEVL